MDISRRGFLGTAAALVACGSPRIVVGDETPAFAPTPTFEPTGLMLTWQHDPTTTMTVQWLGADKQDVIRNPQTLAGL